MGVFLVNFRYTLEEKDCWEFLYLIGFSSLQISSIRGASLSSIKAHVKFLGLSRTLSDSQRGREPWNKGQKGAQTPWNKGQRGVQSSSRKGTKQPKKGPRTPADVEKIREGWRKKVESGWNNWGGYGRKPSPDQRNKQGVLYLVRYLDDSGIHFKLGVTSQTLKERLGSKLISVIHLHYSTFGECFDLEQSQLNYAQEKGWRYSSCSTTELIRPEGIPHLLEVFSELESRALT